MGFFDSFFGDRNNRGHNRFGDARHDDFLDPRSGFWGDMKQSPTWSFWFKDHGNAGMDGEGNPHNGESPTFQGFEDQMPRQPADVETEFRRHMSSFEELFRGVSDMMNGMVPSFPAIQDHQEPPDQSPQSEGQGLTPRDRMLKQPDNDSPPHHPHGHPSNPGAPHDPAFPPMAGSLFGSIFKDLLDGFGPQFGGKDPSFNIEGPHIERGGPQVDRDLDDCEVDILAPRVESSNPGRFFSRGFFQSTSVRTYTTGDGITKREVIKRDGMGNEEKEVTETKNGQVISVKTWTTKDGKTEVTESSSAQDHKKFDSLLAVQPPFVHSTNSIFGKIFGWSWKSDTKPKDN